MNLKKLGALVLGTIFFVTANSYSTYNIYAQSSVQEELSKRNLTLSQARQLARQAGINPERKGMDIAQSFGSSSSYAKKYALGNLLLIDDTQDSDATNTHDKKQKAKNTLTSKTDPAYNKAVDYIKAGGKLEAIKAKYSLSKEIETELSTL